MKRIKKAYENIEIERLKKGMSLQELADALKVSRGAIYSWLKNGDIPATKLIEMAKMFGCSTDYLLGLESA